MIHPKRLLSSILKLSITIGILFFIVHKLGYETIVSTVKGASPFWFIVGVILFVISILLGAFQWRLLLKSRGVEISVKKTISLYYTGIFFNNFMLGMVAGDSYKVANLHLSNKKAESSFAATFFDRIAGLLVISLFAVSGSLYLFIQRGVNQKISGIILIVILFAAILFIFFALFFSKRVQKVAVTFVQKIPSDKIRTTVVDIFNELFIDRHDKKEIKLFQNVFFYSFIIQLLRIIVHITAALSIGIYHSNQIQYFFIIIPIIAFMTIIPLPLGVKETVGGTLFLAAGFDKDGAIIMEFIASIIGITGSLLGGIFFIIDKKEVETSE